MAPKESLREKLYEIIFATQTGAGHRFDIVVTWLIVASVVTVILGTVSQIDNAIPGILNGVEWAITILFTIEYGARIYAARQRMKYVTSFFGIIDLLAILPSFAGIFISGSQSLLIIRILRLLRIFRIFEMRQFVNEGSVVASALKASKTKIIVFLAFVGISSILMGALIYMAENGGNTHIQNIPEGIYWAIVTITTVGYGDVIPVTTLGKMLASVVMILGYGIIAVPTGIVTAEITNRVLNPDKSNNIECPKCKNKTHFKNSSFCNRCGEPLD